MKKTIQQLFAGLMILIAMPLFAAETLQLHWENNQLKGPESVVFDERSKLLFVSNVNGAPTDKNGKGFISTITLDGKMSHVKWVEGLHAPKGLAIFGRKLYVADIDQLLVINIENGRVENKYYAEGAKFLNDVAVDSIGNIYVSDMMTNAIYRLSAGAFNLWLQDDALERPNGITIQGEEIVLASWGVMTDGVNTAVPGHLKTISLASKTIKSLGNGQPIGNLDGVESDGKSRYYVTDWLNGGLFIVHADGKTKKLLTLARGSADLGVVLSENLLLIPMMIDNKLLAYKIQ